MMAHANPKVRLVSIEIMADGCKVLSAEQGK